jgi:hypothetical protein
MTRMPGGFISTKINSADNPLDRTDGGVFTMAEYNNWFLATGQDEYIVAGTYSWVAPSFVPEVNVVAVGGGGGGTASTSGGCGGGGGGLGWKNNIPVALGTSYTVVVAVGGTSSATATSTTNGGASYFNSLTTVAGNGGGRADSITGPTLNVGGTYVGDGGGTGGTGGRGASAALSQGGGGAGGYSGGGGVGAQTSGTNATAGAGGGGGGGGRSGATSTAGAGGGVGILGEGTSGAAGATSTGDASGGLGGSGGGNATQGTINTQFYSAGNPSRPGNYGGGAAGSDVALNEITNGAGGAVRVIYGPNRAFPATNTGNL